MSTVRGLNLTYTSGSDVSFVVANGSSIVPIGYCSDMQFSVQDDNHVFGEKVYVVESALFQLLLGVRLHKHWAGLFIPWAKLILLKPFHVQIQCSV